MAIAARPAPAAPEETRFSRSAFKRMLGIMGVGLLVVGAFVEIMPFVLTIANSFKCDPAVTNRPAAFIPVPPFGVECETRDASGQVVARLSADEQAQGATFNPSFNGYQTILSGSGPNINLPRWLLSTLIYAIAVMLMRLVLDSMAGYTLARLKFRGNRAIFFIILGTLLIPRFLLVNQMGLLNTYQGYILVLAADAFGIMLMKQFFENIPRDLEEAGQVDGADRFTAKFFRIVSPIDFNWGSGSPDAAIAADTFSVRWSGRVEPLYSQTYTFFVTHNDGARLWVNGQQVVNNWANQSAAVTSSGTIALTAGVKVDIVLEYYENTGSASVRLEWESSSQARQVIPKAQLYPPEGQLAFTGGNEIYVVNPDGSGDQIWMVNTTAPYSPRRLTNQGSNYVQSWSPDSTRILFLSTRTGNADIFSVDVTSLPPAGQYPTPSQLTSTTQAESYAVWSADARQVAFIRSNDIRLINADGSNPRQFATAGRVESEIVW